MCRLFLTALATLGWMLNLPAWGQGNYPDRPLKIIVPFTPGGANDVLARTVAPPLQLRLGQPVIVDNKPGAGGHIGGDFVAKSPPDGYALLLMQNGLTMAPWLEKNLTYDPMALAPITISMVLPILVAVKNDLPVSITRKLADEWRLIVNQPDIGERLKKAGFEVAPTTPEEMQAIMRSDSDKLGKVVKDAGIKVE